MMRILRTALVAVATLTLFSAATAIPVATASAEGFAYDLAAELNYHAAEQMVGGYPRTVPDSGYVLWHSQQGSMAALLGSGLIFARSLSLAEGQLTCIVTELTFSD